MDCGQPRYLSGWYDEERHGAHAFRWISRRAVCSLRVPRSPSLLRVVAAHTEPDERRQLSLTLDGRPLGSRAVSARFSPFLFPLLQPDRPGDAEVALEVDRTFVSPGDPRELGLMVRSLEAVDLADGEAPLEGEGWYDLERHEYFPFRWMEARARLVVPPRLRRRGRFASLPVCSDVEDGSQVLELTGNGTLVARIPLLYSWHVYDVELPADGDPAEALDLEFSVNQLLPERVRGADARELGVRVGPLSIHDDGRRHRQVGLVQQAIGDSKGAAGAGATDVDLPDGGEGWSWWEYHDHVPYRWMARRAAVKVAGARRGACRYLAIPIFSEFANLAQVMTIAVGGNVAAEVPLLHGWHDYHVRLPHPGAEDLEVAMSVNSLVPPPFAAGDPRELGARVGRFEFHDEEDRHARSKWHYENGVRNGRELAAGRATLESFPVSLGVDLFGKCNVKPPCVYCPWEQMKDLEGDAADAVVDEETFARYGGFFDGAATLVNCSFGEPLLHPRFAEVMDFFDRHGKTVEISTNGQAFTPSSVRALAGRRVKLFVSLDAATPETYARLRNDRWEEIVAGLSVLREARRRARWLPTLHLVFMPMRTNAGDLEPFVKLCRMVGADSLMLRPLQLESAERPVERGGHRYDFEAEQLGRDELLRLFDDCDRWCRQQGVTLVRQFDFGMTEPERRRMMPDAGPAPAPPASSARPAPAAEEAAAPVAEASAAHSVSPEAIRAAIGELGLEHRHLCREPWESYYILRRGILPCCYGAKPIAPMGEWAAAWNSPVLRDIRSYLAQGKLGPYCRSSVCCPIVQRQLDAERRGASAGGSVPPPGARARRAVEAVRAAAARAVRLLVNRRPRR